MLSRHELANLLADLEACATQVDVVLRRGPHRAEPGTLGHLAALHEAFERGTAIGARVSYAFQGRRYQDVLLPDPRGVRIVRMPEGATSA